MIKTTTAAVVLNCSFFVFSFFFGQVQKYFVSVVISSVRIFYRAVVFTVHIPVRVYTFFFLKKKKVFYGIVREHIGFRYLQFDFGRRLFPFALSPYTILLEMAE